MRISEMVRSVLEMDEAHLKDVTPKPGIFERLKSGTTATGKKLKSAATATGGAIATGAKNTGAAIKSGTRKTGGVIKSGAKLAEKHPWKTAAGLGAAGSALGAATNHPYATYGSAGVSAAIGAGAAIKKLNDMRKARAAKKAAKKADVSGNI
jgi:hypothetical protein